MFKNFLILVIAGFSYSPIKNVLETITEVQLNNFLLIISMLLVTVCFACFGFTYEKSNMENRLVRYFSHFSTFIFLLLILLFLEIIAISVSIVYPSLTLLISILAALLYFSCVCYDFWDLLRYDYRA